jgi:hypothetical protein
MRSRRDQDDDFALQPQFVYPDPVEPIGDPEIRRPLARLLRSEGGPNTIFVEELGLCQGNARVDVAVLGETLEGYEIKSERDSLSRLPAQMDAFGRCLDKVTIVTCERHLDDVKTIVPAWFGIWIARGSKRHVQLAKLRLPSLNPSPDSAAIVQLLWREDAIALLERFGGARGFRAKPRTHVWRELVHRLPGETLRACVRAVLARRLRDRCKLPSDVREVVVGAYGNPLLEIAGAVGPTMRAV